MSKLNCHKTKILKNKGNVKWQIDAFGISMFLFELHFSFSEKKNEFKKLSTVKNCYPCHIVVIKQTI